MWAALPERKREEIRRRLKRSARVAAFFGVSMGLTYFPNSLISLAEPGDPKWWPFLMGFWNASFMFAMDFFVVSRVRWRLFKDYNEALGDVEESERSASPAEEQERP